MWIVSVRIVETVDSIIWNAKSLMKNNIDNKRYNYANMRMAHVMHSKIALTIKLVYREAIINRTF